MNMVENAPKARGEFTLQVLNDKGEVIDQFQENNLVVNTARESMSALLSGKNGSLGITTFVLGTRGHDEVNNDILKPKVVGQDGYDETCTILAKVINYIKVGEIWQKVKRQKYILCMFQRISA